jgi:kynurenine formamidase
MEVIDFTHPLHPGMPVFPGEPGPAFRNIAEMGNQGYRVKWLEMGSHSGTHMDAPAHLISDGKTLDQLPVSHFSGKATILAIPPDTRQISIDFVRQFAGSIGKADYILLNTGWSRHWGEESYFRDFPVLSEEAASWLVSHSLKGVGMDTISADPVESSALTIHRIILNAGMVIIENLCFPERSYPENLFFCCFPLKITEADGSPVRAMAFTD